MKRISQSVAVLLFTSAAMPVLAGTPSISLGAEYTSGKYGTANSTDILTVPLTLGYDTSRWHLKLTLPYVRVSGAGNVIPGIGVASNSNPNGRGRGASNLPGNNPAAIYYGTGSASGIGDVVAKASYTVLQDRESRFGLDLGGRIKFGTADENKGLGTGKNDYGVTVDAYKGIGDWTVFGGVGYTRFGSSVYIPLHNGANANVGASLRVGKNNSVGAYYYYRQRISDFGYRQSEVTGFFNHHFSDSMRLQVYALAGLSNGSPDVGGGASLKWSF